MSKGIFKIFKGIASIGGGALSLYASFNLDFRSVKLDYVSSITYGGDAYTGIQNAAADTANNLKYLGYNLGAGFEDAFQYAFLIVSVLLLTFGLIDIIEGIVEMVANRKAKKALQASAQPMAAMPMAAPVAMPVQAPAPAAMPASAPVEASGENAQ